MKIKHFYILLFLFGNFAQAQKKDQKKKPNIIFFFTDDQAYNTLGIYGNKQVKTPNLDALGEKGIIFDKHYNTTAICMASRANVISGLYEYKTGCNFQHGAMGKEQWSASYPILLKEAGYKIGFAGKFGFTISDRKNVDLRGIDGDYAKQFFHDWKGGRVQTSYKTAVNKPMKAYAKKYPHSSRSYAAATIDFMKTALKEDKPFCMSVYYKAPHKPLEPDPMFDDVYKNTVWELPKNYGKEGGKHLAKQSKTGRQIRYFKDELSSNEKLQEFYRKYHQLVHGVDYSVGMVLEALKDLDIDDNTIVIFSSDNGSHLGSHGFGGKVLPYEEGARVPLLIYDPRSPETSKNKRSASVTGNVDITATILDAAGLDIPKQYDGKSLLPVVYGKKKQARKSLPVIQVWGPESTRCLSVLTDQYKYVNWFYKNPTEGLQPTEELFDVSTDPYEMKNVASNPEYKKVLNKMRRLYDKQVKTWKKESITYNGYHEYGALLDRTVPWEEKQKLIATKDAKLTWENPLKKKTGKSKKDKKK